MQSAIYDSIHCFAAEDWNKLSGTEIPFLQHAFLAALENSAAVGQNSGWLPRYLALHDNNVLCAAVPLFLKNHSYGEFVFDWAWAEAYQQAGLNYYPKLVAAIPYTPVTARKLLIHPAADQQALQTLLIQDAIDYADQQQLSSLHWLFTAASEQKILEDHLLLRRTGCQFHWHNQQYRDFDDFLSTLSAAKRKKIRRERRRIAEQQLTIHVQHGSAVHDDEWRQFHQFYAATFARKMNRPPLTSGFFIEIGKQLRDAVILITARHQGRTVAGALLLRSDHTLYGRHWGSLEHFDKLHFELCYYRAIEYCIEHGLQVFEAGAQGEHKLSRGFKPTLTHSAHWIANDYFRPLIRRYVSQESHAIDDYAADLNKHLPYKHIEEQQ